MYNQKYSIVWVNSTLYQDGREYYTKVSVVIKFWVQQLCV